MSSSRAGLKAAGLLLTLALTACSGSSQPSRARRVGAVERPDVYVYMREHAGQASIAAVEQRIRGSRSIEAFAYISPSDGYDEVQRDDSYPTAQKAAIARTDLPASFRIRLHDSSQRRVVAAQLRGLPNVDLTRGGVTCAHVREARGDFADRFRRVARRRCLKT